MEGKRGGGLKILALDSSGLVASVALAEDDNLIAEYTVQYKKTHSQTLLPMLEEIVRMVEMDLSTVDAIAVAAGPGSFTGLRIGSATAKGLAFALGKPVIPVPTVDGLAFQMYGAKDLVCPIMDARRSQVYTGIYEFMPGQIGRFSYDMRVIREQCAVAFDEIAEALNGLDRSVIFLGGRRTGLLGADGTGNARALHGSAPAPCQTVGGCCRVAREALL